jgi:transcription elongation factor GreB
LAEKNYITPTGFKKLQEEFQYLKHDERPKVVDVVAWAAGNGDRSENGDYIYGKKRLREIDRRLRFLSKQLDRAEIVNPLDVKSTKILFGATVVVIDESDIEKTYCVVGSDESDPEQGKISWKSPLARALFKHEAGDFITYTTPQGERDLEIVEVRYENIP